MPLVTRIDLSALGATSWCSSANDGLHVWLPEALGPLIRASFVRTLRSRPQRNPVRFTSYAATTRMRRSRSNVLHSAHGSAYAAGQQHSLPPHTRKVAGSKPAGTTLITESHRRQWRRLQMTMPTVSVPIRTIATTGIDRLGLSVAVCLKASAFSVAVCRSV
jgi:hypothetical protein